MGDSRLLDSDPASKVRRMFHGATDGNSFVEHATQEVGDRLDLNKALRNEKRGRFGDVNRMASIPIVVWEGLVRQRIVTSGGQILDEPKFRAWLNDSDNEAFRTRLGRI